MDPSNGLGRLSHIFTRSGTGAITEVLVTIQATTATFLEHSAMAVFFFFFYEVEVGPRAESVDYEAYMLWPDLAGQFKATSPHLTLNGGLYREWYQNCLKLGMEIVLSFPGFWV